MATKFFGKRIKRNEDPRLLTGNALFVDDVNLPGMLHVAFYRSPYAHARIKSIDVSQAEAVEGVAAVYTAETLGGYWKTGPLNVNPGYPIEDLVFHARTHPILAREKVRHVGEPVVCVVADSRYIAEDAVNLVVVEFDPLLGCLFCSLRLELVHFGAQLGEFRFDFLLVDLCVIHGFL